MIKEEKAMIDMCNEMGVEWIEGKHKPMLNGKEIDELNLRKLLTEINEQGTYPNTKDQCLELISDIAVDYDGYETVEGLKSIIDELSELAKLARTLKD